MIGDQQNMVVRLRAALPNGWFPSLGAAPVLEAFLNGFAFGFARLYAMLAFIKAQSRIATASGVWLDAIAVDFFGYRVARRPGQTDAILRLRILAELLRPKGTRAGEAAVLSQLTGFAPIVFEPARPADTGGYGVGGVGYGVAGGYGSLLLPAQAFITAFRPAIAGNVSGGGYGVGLGYARSGGQWLNLSSVVGAVSDADIYAAIAATAPAGSIMWTRIAA